MIEIIEEIKKAKQLVNKDKPEDWRVWPGFLMSQAEAKRSLEPLTKKLSEAVLGVAVPVFIDGLKAKELASAMAEQTPVAVVDLDSLYGKLEETIAPTIGKTREFSVSQFVLLINTLRQMAVDNGLAGIEQPKFEEPVIIQNTSMLREQIEKYTKFAVGSELAKQMVVAQMSEQALNTIERKVSVFPVLLLNVKENMRNDISKAFKRPEVSLNSKDEVTEEAAIEALKTIKKTINKKD